MGFSLINNIFHSFRFSPNFSLNLFKKPSKKDIQPFNNLPKLTKFNAIFLLESSTTQRNV